MKVAIIMGSDSDLKNYERDKINFGIFWGECKN